MRTFLYLLLILIVGGCDRSSEVRAVRVERRTVESTVSSVTSGEVRAEKVAELAFGAVGRVQRLAVDLGDHVTKGQILAELENADLLARYRLESLELERKRKLKTHNLISQSEVDLAQSLTDVARGAYEKTLIVAPFDGMIAELNLEEGQLSQITAVLPKALIRIIDRDPRYVRAEIDEVDLPAVQVGQHARIQILAIRKEPFKGTLRKVVPYVSSLREQDRTTEIELEVESEDMLLPVGASADVEIVTARAEGVLALPSRVVLGKTDARYVYLLHAGAAQKRQVKVGLYNFDLTEIREGLAEGEQIIVPTDSVELADGVKVHIAK
ncbi:MAG: efflux RND transporter periplasmic adaptor subunit [Bdellovibrionota bacterium]|nr:MAG: efflux RND transporter periplasmic adaptor subunit [Bdellovibrionota bacterium]